MSHSDARGPKLTRRKFLIVSSLAATGLLAAACGSGTLPSPQGSSAPSASSTPSSTPPSTAPSAAPSSAPSAAPSASGGPTAAVSGGSSSAPATSGQYKEAPQLAQQVKEGKLPPVSERLPKRPLVVKPVEKVGKYGGNWRLGLLGGADTLWLDRTIGHENLVRWDPEWKEIVPNVAESWTVNAESTEFTFKLREGIRWSDGAPFSADDVIFWWEDVQLNKEITPGGPESWMKSGTEFGKIEKIDQFTIKFVFPRPNGLFLTNLPQFGNVYAPKHYLQQFHQKYNPQGIEQLVKENGVDGWVRLYQTKGGVIAGTPYNALWANKDLPRLHGWRIVEPYGGTTRVVAERNPYYWKVDTEGNQLPYIDRATYDIFQDAQTLILRATNGEIDMQDRNLNALANKPVYTENQQRGQYRFFETIPSQMNTCIIALNLTHKDPVKRQIFQNKDFRIGLSHAINRQEIIDVVYVSQGEPWQAAPRKDTPYYNETLAKQYTEFSLDKANAALDKAFPQKNAQGIRLGPNGQPISFVIEVAAANGDQIDVLNLVKTHWQKVGIDAQVKSEDRALQFSRKDANEHDATVWGGDSGLRDTLIRPFWYFPFSIDSTFYAPAWATWYFNRSGAGALTQPEEPPAASKRQMELYDQIRVTGDEAKQNDLMNQILAITQQEFYHIGISLTPTGYGIVKNNFKNVPQRMYSTGGPYLNPAPTNPCQYFFE